MAAIRVVCPTCGQPLKASSEQAGKKLRCPKCQNVFQVSGAAPKPIPVGNQRPQPAAPPIANKPRPIAPAASSGGPAPSPQSAQEEMVAALEREETLQKQLRHAESVRVTFVSHSEKGRRPAPDKWHQGKMRFLDGTLYLMGEKQEKEGNTMLGAMVGGAQGGLGGALAGAAMAAMMDGAEGALSAKNRGPGDVRIRLAGTTFHANRKHESLVVQRPGGQVLNICKVDTKRSSISFPEALALIESSGGIVSEDKLSLRQERQQKIVFLVLIALLLIPMVLCSGVLFSTATYAPAFGILIAALAVGGLAIKYLALPLFATPSKPPNESA